MNTHTMTSMEASTNLKSLLSEIAGCVDADFSGLGIIIWDGIAGLPIYPMRGRLPKNIESRNLTEMLKGIASTSSIYHDGFHVLNQSFQPTHAAVYFSPPIIPHLAIPVHAQFFGGRYLAAIFGSCLDGVLCTGVLSNTYGPYVFHRGREV